MTNIADGARPAGHFADLPDDLPIEERDAVRVVVLDPDNRILLFHTRYPGSPELGTWWELPGGGLDPGETHVAAAIRELWEETGIRVVPGQVSEPLWRRTATFRYRQVRRVQHEVVVTARLDGTPIVDVSGQLDYELEDYTDSRWWPVAEVRASDCRFYPGRLPQLLDAHLRGEEINEPFEFWS
ncbi:MAG TPA: NUDIX domain-containing protein [Micromonosporaceae bacterium]|nr:NUDIX domain-containing protein [Micromonosporaceae bacterium]